MLDTMQAVAAQGELFTAVVDLIHTASAKSRTQVIAPGSLLLEELSLDSLDLVRIIMLIEDRYQVSIDLDEVPKLKRVEDLTATLARELRAAA
ncbi:acyl carrier protein [Aquisphaera giovannonii]|uniref:Acyl carrier protein n=1 Tax=Aquisphaera giovannonii TaxID=406548 RepID=A0A5B9W0A5_9BACT|nr:phosphopantetheine-binding protein [Aquisphaera giovannonii]QEH33711.1 acyl carrier protein [Aquisphaera giovannonii]